MEINNPKLILQIEQAKAGDQAAFKYLLDTFWSDVYAFQLKRTKNEYDAEEITIQTFSRAFDRLETFNDNYVFKTWLITISKNIHIDLIRKKMHPLGPKLQMNPTIRFPELLMKPLPLKIL